MKLMHDVAALQAFALYFGAALAMLVIFTRVYLWTTPYDDMNDIRRGKYAPAVALMGAMLGFTAPILAAQYAGTNIADFLKWGAVMCIVQVICFKVLYWVLPKQIEEGNGAAALVYAGAAVCVGLLSAISIIP